MVKLVCAGVGQLNQRVAAGWLAQSPNHVAEGFRLSTSDASLGFHQKSVDLAHQPWPDAEADYLVIALAARERSQQGYERAYRLPILKLAESIQQWQTLPKRIIVVSSTRVYGVSDGRWIHDDTEPSPSDANGQILRDMELAALALPAPTSVVRLSGIYGPGRDWLKRQALTATQNSIEKNNWTNRIHIDDAAAAILHLLEQPVLKPSYIVSDTQSVPLLEMYNFFREREGLPLLQINDYPVQGGKRLTPDALQEIGFQWQYPTAFSGGYE